MTKLSDTQAILLAAAAGRPDLSLLPVPETINLKGAALDRTVTALLSRGLVADAAVGGRAKPPKRSSKQIVITPAGVAAIGVEISEASPEQSQEEPNAELQTETADCSERLGGKLGVLLDAVAGPNGATLEELTKASGWLPHTTRAALTRLRQRGFDVRLAITDGRKAYHLVPAA
jgi:hypothetical protein